MAVLILLFIIITFATIILAIPLSRLLLRITYTPPFPKIESLIHLPSEKQSGMEFLASLVIFNALVFALGIVVLMIQNVLPFNPAGTEGLNLDLAVNLSMSFISGTDWQTYAGETALSYFSQTFLSFSSLVASSSGIAAAMLVMHGISSHDTTVSGKIFLNYWQSVFRISTYFFIPLCTLFSLILVFEGTIQNFAAYTLTETLEGAKILIPQGPVAVFKSISLLGVNGGGFFNTNSAHPYENPSDISNILQIIMMCLVPTSIILCYSKTIGKKNHGIAILVFVYLTFIISALALHKIEASGALENLEGKELRFGMLGSTLYASYSSYTCGGANAALASFNPYSLTLILTKILLGGYVLGGSGPGYLNLMIYIILAVFFSGMMAGRSPKFLGKKIDSAEIKYLMYYVVIYQCLILTLTTISLHSLSNIETPSNSMELTKVFMMNSSTVTNNGSIIGADYLGSTFLNYVTTFAMLAGRILLFFCLIKTAANMAVKKINYSKIYEVQTDSVFFILVVGLVVISDFLVFIPVIIIAPLMAALVGG